MNIYVTARLTKESFSKLSLLDMGRGDLLSSLKLIFTRNVSWRREEKFGKRLCSKMLFEHRCMFDIVSRDVEERDGRNTGWIDVTNRQFLSRASWKGEE